MKLVRFIVISLSFYSFVECSGSISDYSKGYRKCRDMEDYLKVYKVGPYSANMSTAEITKQFFNDNSSFNDNSRSCNWTRDKAKKQVIIWDNATRKAITNIRSQIDSRKEAEQLSRLTDEKVRQLGPLGQQAISIKQEDVLQESMQQSRVEEK